LSPPLGFDKIAKRFGAMNPFVHLFSRLLLHILALTLSSSFCLAAENDDVRRRDAARPSKTGAARTDANGRQPPPINLHSAAQSPKYSGRPGTAASPKSKATFRSVRRLMRTRRLLLAALRVWELKNGYGRY